MASNSKNTSQYLDTQIKNWYLDIMSFREVPSSPYDKIIRIPAKFDQRPDLLSHAEYGTPKLWWIFAMRNPDLINDPIADFVSGLEIYVPANILKN